MRRPRCLAICRTTRSSETVLSRATTRASSWQRMGSSCAGVTGTKAAAGLATVAATPIKQTGYPAAKGGLVSLTLELVG